MPRSSSGAPRRGKAKSAARKPSPSPGAPQRVPGRPDRILIRGLRARCVIGAFPKERGILQPVRMDIALDVEVPDAAASDRLEDTVDYKALKRRILGLVEGSRHHLLEALAEQVAAACLSDPRVVQVELTVDKPGALTGARSVAVQVVRRRP